VVTDLMFAEGIARLGSVVYAPRMDAATIEHEAMRLNAVERALLADRLLLTLNLENGERMERWGRESEGRLRAFERREIRETDGPAAVAGNVWGELPATLGR
jgi:hypothetical protein